MLQVIPDLPFIHPSEVALLNRISRLGTYYLQLKDFILLQNASSVALNPADSEGKYHTIVPAVLQKFSHLCIKVLKAQFYFFSMLLTHRSRRQSVPEGFGIWDRQSSRCIQAEACDYGRKGD